MSEFSHPTGPWQDPAPTDPRRPHQPVRARSLKPLVKIYDRVLEPDSPVAGVGAAERVQCDRGELDVRLGCDGLDLGDPSQPLVDALLQRSVRGCVTGFSTTALCSVRSTEVVGLPCAS